VDPEIEAFAALVGAARRGSPDDCRTLYERRAGRVCGYLRFHGAADPEDLTSEVFLRVFTHLDDFTGSADGFRGWVFTIAFRVLVDERRRQSRRPVTVELSAPAAASVPGGDAEHDALEELEHERVTDLLSYLTPDQRDVITLRVVADLPINDVAAALGKEPGTVKALQHRGIAALRRHLERSHS
jgi:RNA polymerase sigma factor (sigma-70 family)